MSTIDHIQSLHHSPVPSGEGLHIGIAVAEWNNNITEPLLEGALEVLRKQEVKKITVFRVPGAFELVNASARLLNDGVDAVIAIGCVVRGDTPHFDYDLPGRDLRHIPAEHGHGTWLPHDSCTRHLRRPDDRNDGAG